MLVTRSNLQALQSGHSLRMGTPPDIFVDIAADGSLVSVGTVGSKPGDMPQYVSYQSLACAFHALGLPTMKRMESPVEGSTG
jgi:hypothetical protein